MKDWVSEALFGSGADSQGEEGYSRYLSITTEAANIREFPSLSAPILTQITSSQQILYLEKDEVDGEGRTWYRVRDEYGNEGWLSSSIVVDMSNVDASSSAEEEPENASIYQVYEEDITQFIYAFQESYMNSLNHKDLSLVAPYLVYQSSIYREIEEYISMLGSEYYQFHDLSILSIESNGNNRYTVRTYETFDLTDSEGQVTYNERDKTYTLYVQGESSFVIEHIEITSTYSN